MSDLSDDARALLRLTRHAGEPDAASLARVRASLLGKVAGAVGGGAALGAAAAGASKVASSAPPAVGATTATMSTSVLAIVAKGIGVALVLGASAAAIHAYDARIHEPASPSAVAPGRSTAAPAPSPIVIATATATAAASSSAAATAVPVTALPASPSKAARRPARTSMPPAPENISSETATAPSLAEDLARLRDAQRALAGGRPERALEAAEAVRDSSPLGEERDGIRAIARGALAKQATGDARPAAADLARRESERFLAAHPGASLGARVRSACGDSN